MGVGLLLERRFKRLILTRPAVEAGEKLGFLPGDMVEKVNPYLRPLYDALNDMLDFRKVREMLDTGVIEVAPLAFMGPAGTDAGQIAGGQRQAFPVQPEPGDAGEHESHTGGLVNVLGESRLAIGGQTDLQAGQIGIRAVEKNLRGEETAAGGHGPQPAAFKLRGRRTRRSGQRARP